MASALPLSRDAATVVGLAGSALPFANSPAEEVERWLRPLQLYGEAAVILQSLGIGEERPAAFTDELRLEVSHRPEDTVAAIVPGAEKVASQRGRPAIGTSDILVAVMRHYRHPFEQAIESRGSDRWELTDRLAESLHGPLR